MSLFDLLFDMRWGDRGIAAMVVAVSIFLLWQMATGELGEDEEQFGYDFVEGWKDDA